eukprot:gene14001-14119_t
MNKILSLAFGLILASAGHVYALDQSPPPDGISLERILKSGGKQFDRLDANHDGLIDPAEWSAYVDAQVNKLKDRMAKRWADMDLKKRGKVSREDFLAARAKWFAEVDSDKTGFINSEKIHRYNLHQGAPPDL